ncbi:ABC transporter permease subunit [Nesterenkonia sp. YGD6]|uniref:ABC transporter permease subunit n=1 Tax=Nesterenkonia sp. YGD6 TaxID=2901231 RepID=UPI001F4C7F36|nr:ABC transporter permease subunit [Nesterenkonia sp. YGD6]MCH8562895.1 ABC transporter permease subunit [Nesterenkonia sp. YGD6]
MSATLLPGFANQARREAGTWWSTKRWWIQTLVWTGIINGLLAVMLWVVPQLEALVGAEVTVQASAAQFTGMASMITAIGVVVTSQGILLDEHRVGLLEWMLSKPLSRGALLAAKFVAHALALLVVLVIIPWLGVLIQLSLADGDPWPLDQWLGALGLVCLVAVFHLALVLALSALTWSRAMIVALPLVGIIGTDLFVAFVPESFNVMPWSLGPLAGPVLADGMLISIGPIVSASLLMLVSLGVAAAGIRRKEL